MAPNVIILLLLLVPWRKFKQQQLGVVVVMLELGFLDHGLKLLRPALL